MNPNDPNFKDDANKPFESPEEPSKKEREPKTDREWQKGSDVMNYMQQHKEAAITYTLLAVGILLLIFNVFLSGSILIGLVAGYHFSHEIVFYLRNLTQIFAGQDQVRYIVLTAVIIALFIAIPGIFLGAIVAAVLKQSIWGEGQT